MKSGYICVLCVLIFSQISCSQEKRNASFADSTKIPVWFSNVSKVKIIDLGKCFNILNFAAKGLFADQDSTNGENTNIVIVDCEFGFCHAALKPFTTKISSCAIVMSTKQNGFYGSKCVLIHRRNMSIYGGRHK